MFDYLNEVMLLYGKKNRRNGTYKKAAGIKARGDAVIFNALCERWCSRFKWESKTPTIATELIERTILFSGVCGLAKYSETSGSYTAESWRNFMVSNIDNQSFYGYPNSVQLTDYVGRNCGTFIPVHDEDTSEIANCALIYDNPLRVPPLMSLLHYADRLSVLNTAIDACTRNITGTSIIQCTHGQERQIVKQMAAAEMGVPYIVTYDETDIHPMTPQLISTGQMSDALVILYESYDKTMGEFLQSIGINSNAELNKKSGVTPMEVMEDRKVIGLLLNDGLDARRKGIKHFERIGGRGLSVSLERFENPVSTYDNNGNLIAGKESGNNVESDKLEGYTGV